MRVTFVPFIMPNSFMRYALSSLFYHLPYNQWWLLTKEGLCDKCWPLIIIHLTSFYCSIQVTSRGICWVPTKKEHKTMPQCLSLLPDFSLCLSLAGKFLRSTNVGSHEAIRQQVLDWLVNTVSAIAVERRDRFGWSLLNQLHINHEV